MRAKVSSIRHCCFAKFLDFIKRWGMIGTFFFFFFFCSGRRSVWGGWRGSAERWDRDPSSALIQVVDFRCFYNYVVKLGTQLLEALVSPFWCFDTFLFGLIRLMLLAENNAVTAFANQHDLLYAFLILSLLFFAYKWQPDCFISTAIV